MKVNLLFSIDDHFVDQLKTTLFSIRQNTSKAAVFTVYVLQKKPFYEDAEIKTFCQNLGMQYIPLILGKEELFKQAPVSSRYPETIYYRLLAHQYLPKTVDRILYLDADILCINDLLPLYQLDISNYLYAAASHKQLTQVAKVINQVRLKTYESEGYYNSGVLLMNLAAIRQRVQAEDIFSFIHENPFNLLLPDQDILNGLYGKEILSIPDEIYNYDVRKNPTYETISRGVWDLDWVMGHSVFLHFCGKEKPWENKYHGRYAALYKHYWHKALKN